MTHAEAAPATSHLGAAQTERILIATINRPAGVTGVHTHTRVLRDGLLAGGVTCRVIDPFSGNRLWWPVFAMRRALRMLNRTWGLCWYRRWHMRALYGNLAAALRREGASAVVAQCPLSARAALDARADLGLSFRIAMVCHFNHSEASEYREQGELRGRRAFDAIDRFERDVLQSVDDVVYVSAWARDAVERDRGIPPRRSHVIHNGIPDLRPGRELRRSDLGLAKDDVVLISVGTLEPRKNQLGLVELFARIATAHPKVKLVLVGDGPDRAAIAQRIAAGELDGRAILLGHRRDVPDLLNLADVYVHMARLENCPVALIEAARAGLPFAAVYAGGIAELAEVLQSGVELEADDPDLAGEALSALIGDEDMRRRLGAAACANFERHLTERAMVDAYLRVLREAP